MQKITKAVIPCGGMGTRFLPITKAVAKELLPVIDKPVVAFIVDELIESGVTDILIILGKNKEGIREYFGENAALEAVVKGKPVYELYKRASVDANITFTYQDEPKGSGDAIARAEFFTKDEPFIVCNGDDMIVSAVPCSKQLIDAYERSGKTLMGVQEVAADQTDKYGILKVGKIDGKLVECLGMVEKPKSAPPSRYAALGRYVFTSEIYGAIKKVTPDAKGEYQLTDAIKMLIDEGKVCGYDFDGRRYDMGDKFGAVTATIDYALSSPDFGADVLQYITNIVKLK